LVKSVENGVRNNTAGSVTTMPLALHRVVANPR
jgi:hypothetical protein